MIWLQTEISESTWLFDNVLYVEIKEKNCFGQNIFQVWSPCRIGEKIAKLTSETGNVTKGKEDIFSATIKDFYKTRFRVFLRYHYNLDQLFCMVVMSVITNIDRFNQTRLYNWVFKVLSCVFGCLTLVGYPFKIPHSQNNNT